MLWKYISILTDFHSIDVPTDKDSASIADNNFNSFPQNMLKDTVAILNV